MQIVRSACLLHALLAPEHSHYQYNFKCAANPIAYLLKYVLQKT